MVHPKIILVSTQNKDCPAANNSVHRPSKGKAH